MSAVKSVAKTLLDADTHRSRQLEFSRLAETANSPREREYYLRMARTSELLAKNAEWVRSTDAFLDQWRR